MNYSFHNRVQQDTEIFISSFFETLFVSIILENMNKKTVLLQLKVLSSLFHDAW